MTTAALPPCIASSGAISDTIQRLSPYPAVLEAVRRRGLRLTLRGDPDDLRDPDESRDPDDWENRVGTALMALYRDERTEESFAALYEFSRPSVLLWIRSLLHRGLSHLDPVELLQDTFVNVYRYPSGFREEHAGSFRVWVRTIAGNIVRRAGARRHRFSFQELPEGLQEPADSREDPERAALASDEEKNLRTAWMLFLAHYQRAWEELSERDRRTLQLVEVDGLSYQEAGRILGVGRSNMKMIVFRARKRIARRMRSTMAGARWALLELGAA